jgi:PKD repeat protein
MEKSRQIQHAGETESQQAFEGWIDQRLDETTRTRSGRRTDATVYTIPVVVHVIYSNPSENISEQQVQSQIDVLNQDYRRQNPNSSLTPAAFRGVASDTRIEFCLAQVDPQGQATNGIHRVSHSGSPFTEEGINNQIKPQTSWDPTRYFNIWVCNIADGILGFAQFPHSSRVQGIPASSTAATTDGVVINHRAFGTLGTVAAPFDGGRTATHEIGHWLGLRHVWGDGNCDVDDFCPDTPPTASAHFDCPAASIACNGDRAMVSNFMDYTDDACMNLVTQDQMNRMRLVLESSPRRQELLTSTACQSPVSPPEPAFAASLQTGCSPLNVRFNNRSQGANLTYTWKFEGGKPSSSTDVNPEVTYKTPGRYPVTLAATNAAGTRVARQEGYIEVLASGVTLPFVADFEGQDFPPTGLTVYNPQHDYPWQRDVRVSGEGKSTASLTINNFDNQQRGGLDWLITPVMDFSQQQEVQLSFKVAYAPFNQQYSDTLGVFIATDCGTTFRNIYFKGGQRLATASASNDAFRPGQTQWRSEVIDLSEWAGRSHVQVAFVNRAGYGNYLYLDDIRVEPKRQPAPTPDFFASKTSVCVGDTIRFEDRSDQAPTRWVWSFPGGTPASDTLRRTYIRYERPGRYAVSLTAANADGSQSITRQEYIEVKASPLLTLTASDNEPCLGESVTLSAQSNTPIEWRLPAGIRPPRDKQLTLTPETDAVYAVTTRDPETSCLARAEVTVRVGSGRQLAVTPPSATVCLGSSVTLNATGASSYQWTPSDGLDHPNSGLVKASPSQTTTYTVLGISPGCTTRQEITVLVESPPADFRIVAERLRICPGEQVSLTASGAVSYQWSPASSLNQREGAKVMAQPEVSTRYQVLALSDNGCQATREVEIEVAPQPEVSLIASKQTVCPGEEVRVMAQGAASYEWPTREDLSPSGSQAMAFPKEATEYRVVGRNASGCSDTARIALNVYPSPPVTLTASRQTLCPGDRTVLIASGAESYLFYPAQAIKPMPDQPNQASVVIQRDQTFSVIGTDTRGCQVEASVDIDVADDLSEQPLAAFTVSSTSTCAGQEVQFLSQARSAAQYSWSFEGGTPSSSFDPNPKVMFREEGLHDVRLTVRSCAGLQDTREEPGYMLVTAPFDLRLNTGDISVCQGAPFQLTATGGDTYAWQPSRYLDQATGRNVTARLEQSTTYTVTATDAQGCQAQRSVTLTVVGEGREVSLKPFAPVICEGGEVTLQASGGVSYTWTPERGLDRSYGASVLAKPATTTTYTVEVTTVDGCTFRKEVTVTVKDANSLTLTASEQEICPGERVVLSTAGEGFFRWTPADKLSAATGQQVEAFPQATTTFTVSGVDDNGCRAEAQTTVRVLASNQLTVSAVDPTICVGTTTELSAKGDGPFTWSPAKGLLQRQGATVTASPQETTTYTVKSGSGRCQAEKRITVEVLQPKAIAIQPEDPAICPGTGLTLEATTGSRLRWSGPGLNTAFGQSVQVSPAQTTSYTVSGLDAQGCEATGSVSVAVKAADFVQVTSSASTVCAGDEVALSATGASRYRWEGPTLSEVETAQVYSSPEQTATYRVVGTDAFGCEDTASLKVEVGRMQASFQMSTDRIDLARTLGVVDFSAQTPSGQEWLWDFGEGSQSQEANPVHVYDEVGTYTVTMLVSNGICTGRATQQLVIENSSSLEALTSEGFFRVSPPGSDGIVNLALNSPQEMFLRLRLLNADGKQLVTAALRLREGPYQQQLDLSSFPSGTYYLQLLDGIESVMEQFTY